MAPCIVPPVMNTIDVGLTTATTGVGTSVAGAGTAVGGAMTAAGTAITGAVTGLTTALTAQKQQSFFQKIVEYTEKTIKYTMLVINVFKFMFMLFPIIIVFRLIIGLFTKPMEYIMLAITIFALAMLFVVYYIFYIPPFSVVPFIIYFAIMDLIPLAIYIVFYGIPFIVATLVCMIMTVLNYLFAGALSSLVLCQNSPASWYKTPNFHLNNKYQRGLMCSRQCLPGYYPDQTGLFCVSTPKQAPSFCPQAQAMRLYTVNKNDFKYIYGDHPGLVHPKYLFATPEQREIMLKDHFLKKRDFFIKCQDPMAPYNYMPLSICSSIDAMAINNENKQTINKLKKVCAQAYCNSQSNFPFCAQIGDATNDNEDGAFWRRVITILIMIVSFLVIVMFTLSYMVGQGVPSGATE